MNKNKINAGTVIIIVLLVLLIFTIGYIIYENSKTQGYIDNKTENLHSNKEKALSIENELVKELYESTQFNFLGCGEKPYFLNYNIRINKKFLVENLTDLDKLKLAVHNIEEEAQEDENISRVYYSEEQVNNSLKKIFGNNYKFDKYKTINNPPWHYSEENKRFETVIFGIVCGQAAEHIVTELYKAKEGISYIDIYQILAYDQLVEINELTYSRVTKLYKDEERKQIIDDNFEDTELLSKYVEQLPQYKYTFKKDNKTGNYYFYSIERVN